MAVALAVFILAFGHSTTVGEFFWYYVASLLIDLPEGRADKAVCCFSTVLLSFNMLAGRLEIFPMLMLLAPSTWRSN